MENPEEVLQALDEFQKLRPAEIPKELEEYLSWVAKTGDPVYQWPLIKALFREKLLRVMTDFYESCPSLELAPCPNVEQFNYDTMKSALLDRLETFVNAPFTVQRICELLTAPRKEYNRVDKFMRAIEKNILVVSTREPGPSARRSENGDGMVNGSSEDNGSRSPYDMDLWTRACTLATTVTVQTVESHSTIVNVHNLPANVIPATELTIVKNNTTSAESFTPYGGENDVEMASKGQELAGTFTPSTSEIASIANLTSQIQPQDLNPTSGIQNLSNMVAEPGPIVGDVPEAIMNEDTNSQPSLDLDNSESESFETTRKLQTTFQSSDFITHSIKTSKFYSQDNDKTVEKSVVEAESLRNDVETEHKPAEDEAKTQNTDAENGEPAAVITAESIEMTEHIDKTTEIEPSPAVEENSEVLHSKIEETLPKESIKDAPMIDNGIESALLVINTEKVEVSSVKVNIAENETDLEVNSTSVTTETVTSMEIGAKVAEDTAIPEPTKAQDSEDSLKMCEGDEKPVEDKEPVKETEESKKQDDDINAPLTTIEEITEEVVTKVTKSIVPEPLPIVEEPKDEGAASSPEHGQIAVDVTDEDDKETLPLGESDKVETKDVSSTDTEAKDAEAEPQLSTETPIAKTPDAASGPVESIVPAESMEVDVNEGSKTFERDEPMEEEASDLDKS